MDMKRLATASSGLPKEYTFEEVLVTPGVFHRITKYLPDIAWYIVTCDNDEKNNYVTFAIRASGGEIQALNKCVWENRKFVKATRILSGKLS